MKLNKLLFGGFSGILIKDANPSEATISKEALLNVFAQLSEINITVKNASALVSMTEDTAKDMLTTLCNVQNTSTKTGTIFRIEFLTSEGIEGYTTKDFEAIYAQYSLTYGWSNVFESYFGETPEDVVKNYFGNKLKNVININKNKEPKEVTLYTLFEFEALIKSILESTRSLNKHEIELINSVPYGVLQFVSNDAYITFNETKNIVISRCIKESDTLLASKYLKNPTDIVRLVLSDFSSPEITGKFDKNDLRSIKLYIPKSARKLLVNVLNGMNVQNAAEDMLKYRQFWKRIVRYLMWEPVTKRNTKYNSYAKMIELLYNNNTSWTFNSRYETAKLSGDYDKAIHVAAERPGFLMRNLLEFLRMTEGSTFPVKIGLVKNTMNNILKIDRYIVKDASEYLASDDFKRLLMSCNTKLLWELIVQLEDKNNYISTTERTVQGKVVKYEYNAPYLGLNKKLCKQVKTLISNTIKSKKRAENVQLGKVYVSPDTKNVVIPFSDRSNQSISLSGEILYSGAKIKLDESKIIRTGIMWKGSISTDLDLSSMFHKKGYDDYSGSFDELSWRSPHIHNVGVSSGDITYCRSDAFSTECIDIDLSKVQDYDLVYNHVVSFSGASMDKLDTYFFIEVIDAKNKMTRTNSHKVSVDLSTVDYAVKIENKDSRSQLGFYINFNKMEAVVMNKTLTSKSLLASGTINEVLEEIKNNKSLLSMNKCLKKCINKDQFVLTPEEADTIISKDQGLHPSRNITQIQKMVF